MIVDNKDFKIINIEQDPYYYRSFFNKDNGCFVRLGKTKNDDPDWCSACPELLDIEISTICKQGCKFCYKNNTAKGEYMCIDHFKIIMEEMPNTVSQIAFGIGDISGNPDLEAILKHTRSLGIIPNITINGREHDYESLLMLARYCGAISVSHYDTYNLMETVRILNLYKNQPDLPLRQVNIHQLLSLETADNCYKILRMAAEKEINIDAIVFLSLKHKGRAADLPDDFKPAAQQLIADLITESQKLKVQIGFDSCNGPQILGLKNTQVLKESIEPCESTLFSAYINVEGKFFPCSFMENTSTFPEGLDTTMHESFLQNVWLHPKTVEFRKNLLKNQRVCPHYKI